MNSIDYSITVTHFSSGAPVEFMLFFSGIDAYGYFVIFDYHSGILDPSESTEYSHTFTYLDPLGATIDINYQYIDGQVIDEIL